MVQFLWRAVWQFSVFRKLHTESPENPALPLLDAHLRDLQTYVTQGLTHGCSWQHHSLLARSGGKPNVRQLVYSSPLPIFKLSYLSIFIVEL